MAIGVLLIKQPATTGAAVIDELFLLSVVLDVTLNENHKHEVEWTSHPVEGTALEITDHAIIKPDEVSISGVITDTPLPPAGTPYPDRAADMYERLLLLMRSKRTMTLVTGNKVYYNMAITGVSSSRTPATGQSVRPSIDLRQVRIVNSVVVPVPPGILKPKVAVGGASTVPGGKQLPAEASALPTTELSPDDHALSMEAELEAVISGEKSGLASLFDTLTQ